MIEPKPCPFCGGIDLEIADDEHPTGSMAYAVLCECSALGPAATSVEVAKERWNSRKLPQ